MLVGWVQELHHDQAVIFSLNILPKVSCLFSWLLESLVPPGLLGRGMDRPPYSHARFHQAWCLLAIFVVAIYLLQPFLSKRLSFFVASGISFDSLP